MLDKYLNPDKKEETAAEFGERLQKKFEEFKEEVAQVNSQEKLDEMEKVILADLQELDDHIRTLEYDVPASCEYDGKTYKRSEVAAKIIYYINKQEVDWQYCDGLFQLCKVWRNMTDRVRYGVLDSTLRILGQSKSKGESEWRDTAIINAFVQSMDASYSKDLSVQYYLSKKHSEIMARRDLITPVSKTETAPAQ